MLVSRTPKSMFTKLQKTFDAEEERDRPFDEKFVFSRSVEKCMSGFH